ncbi:MAG: hypothetical protein ACNYPH_06330 [Gammaproteobacteria bacterium WSBS_2016_MAG_OTU1]
MKNKYILGASILTAAVLISGCSTVLRGTHEKVEIISSPEKALCRIYRGSEGYLKAVATPGAVYLPRSSDDIKVVCKKDGYKTTTIVASPVKTSDIVGNAVTGGGSAIADLINSAHADLPDTIRVNLSKN